jgi:DNA-binding winged helix-turn-helix (wHTH) protein
MAEAATKSNRSNGAHVHWQMEHKRTVASNGVHGTLRFGPFELSKSTRVLRRDGVTLPLGGRAFDILVYLAERPGEVIGKKELMDHVWSNVTVLEGSLRVHVAAVRKALRDGQFGNRYIANVKGRGYSFIATVVRLEERADNVREWPQYRRRLPERPPEKNRMHQMHTLVLVLAEGAGLGFSMTHIIVKQHGGRINVETEPGKFAEFIITLPRDDCTAADEEPE